MTTNKPEVKRYDMSACPEHICRVLDMQESEDGDFVEWEAYETLQAECEKLRSLIHDIKEWDCAVDGGFLSIPLDLRRRIQKAIDAAIAAHRKGGES